MTYVLLFFVALWAGAQNALAGGGSFLILPALMFSGMDALAANITSCVALFPAQIASGWTGRHTAAGVGGLQLRTFFILSIIGGAIGAVILLITPRGLFAHLVPWLVLFATLVFIWGSFLRKPDASNFHLKPQTAAITQFLIAIYGGYFGGGIGFLMLAVLTIAGQQVRMAAATKNILAMAMNASAVALFVFSGQVHWHAAMALAIGGIGGAFAGNYLLHRVSAKLLRGFVILVGIILTTWLFLR